MKKKNNALRSEEYWLKKFNIKPCKVRLTRITLPVIIPIKQRNQNQSEDLPPIRFIFSPWMPKSAKFSRYSFAPVANK